MALGNEVTCYVDGVKCHVKDPAVNRYIDVTSTVAHALDGIVGDGIVVSDEEVNARINQLKDEATERYDEQTGLLDWLLSFFPGFSFPSEGALEDYLNYLDSPEIRAAQVRIIRERKLMQDVVAFPCGVHSVFTYVDRTTKYDFWLEPMVGATPEEVVSYHSTGEVVPDGNGVVNGEIELSVSNPYDVNDKPSWTNNVTSSLPVALTLRRMDPPPYSEGAGPYWEAPGTSGMSADPKVLTPETCRSSGGTSWAQQTVFLKPDEIINWIGVNIGALESSRSWWRVTYAIESTRQYQPTRICTRLIDGTICECIYDEEILINETTCETRRIPIVWRTKGLAGRYDWIDDAVYDMGEYVFLDPFIGLDVYDPFPGNTVEELDHFTGRIFGGRHTPDYAMQIGETHYFARQPSRWRTEMVSEIQPPDITSEGADPEGIDIVNPEQLALAYKGKRIPEDLFARFRMGLARFNPYYSTYYDENGNLKPGVEPWAVPGYVYATYYDEDGNLVQDTEMFFDGTEPVSWQDVLDESPAIVPPSVEAKTLSAAFEDGVAKQIVERLCEDFTTKGDIVLGTLPLIWFKKIHNEKTATVVLKGTDLVKTIPYACAGVSEFGQGIALMCLEHVHNGDALMTEHAHLQVYVKEPRKEQATMTWQGFGHGGSGLNGLFKQTGGVAYSIFNDHMTHASLTPYLPNIFGTAEIGSPPLQNKSSVTNNRVLYTDPHAVTRTVSGSAYVPSGASSNPLADDKDVMMETSQEMIKPNTKDLKSIGQYLAVKPSYLLFLMDDENITDDVIGSYAEREEYPSERPPRNSSGVSLSTPEESKFLRISNMESPVSYDHAGHWRELWADVGVQSAVPLSGAILPFGGLSPGRKDPSRVLTTEARRLEDGLKHSQFDFVPSKPLLSKDGVGVVGSNGMLVVFTVDGEIIRYDVENFGP